MNEESVAGWQAIGFSNNDALPEFGLDQRASLVQAILSTQNAATGGTSEMAARFFEVFGAPVNCECHLIPVLRKEKVAAVLYADAGNADTSCESSTLDVLVRFTSLWLEVRAMRTFAAAAPVEGAITSTEGMPAAAPAWPAHAPVPQPQMRAVSAPALQHQASPAQAQAAFAAAANAAEVAHPVHTVAAPSPAPESPVAAPVSAEDTEVHRKAQRFAKLLTDEIKLYNKAKVEEGRKNHDIYDRLRDDIDKSRASYVKRYGNTVAASTDYFSQELIRGLAQEDASLLGSNFQR